MEYLSGPLLAFLGISVLVIVTPGPDTAVTIRNTLLGGRAAGLATAAGVATGQAIWAFATSAGLVALLVASEPLFLVLKYAGAAYLVWLGLLSLRNAVRRGPSQPTIWPTTALSLKPRGAFGLGLLSDLGNPKMAAFFTTLLWLAGYAVAIARIGNLLRGGPIRRLLDGLTGLALVGLGLRLAVEER